MQVSIYSAVPSSIVTMPKVAASAPRTVVSSEPTSIRKGIDFSCVTPRQLNEYVDARIFANDIDPDEADGLMNMLTSTQMDEAPDVPFDLRARMIGTKEFHQDRGDPVAAFYASLIKRLDEMEAQSLRVDAFA